jgi:RNA polymerase sigma-70 factor (ECF subfamily)
MEEKRLVKQILEGDKSAFTILINRYKRLVGHMVARLIDDDRDREEVAQDIFVKVYQKLAGFEFNSKLSTWIATIAYRHAINHLKKNKKWNETEDIDEINLDDGAWDQSVENTDQAAFVHHWIQKLPENYRVVLTLYHLEGMSYPEIIAIMDMPEGTVKNYLFRARKKLKDLLSPHLETELLIHG